MVTNLLHFFKMVWLPAEVLKGFMFKIIFWTLSLRMAQQGKFSVLCWSLPWRRILTVGRFCINYVNASGSQTWKGIRITTKAFKITYILGFFSRDSVGRRVGCGILSLFPSLLCSYTVRFGNHCLYNPPWGVFILLYGFHSALCVLLFRTFSH